VVSDYSTLERPRFGVAPAPHDLLIKAPVHPRACGDTTRGALMGRQETARGWRNETWEQRSDSGRPSQLGKREQKAGYG